MKILLTRTDRIGDVVLTTPAIKAVRDKYPKAYIAFLVRPYTKHIVEGNPYLDEVIIYDKYGKHKSFFRAFKFALSLRKRKFDLAIMLHPTNRVHLMAFLAGIRERVGYNKKLGFLLTKKIPHTKQKGEKHEVEYVLEMLRELKIKPREAEDIELYVPVHERDIAKITRIFEKNNIAKNDFLIAVNSGASGHPKVWPPENFAAVCDAVAEEFSAKIMLVADDKNIEYSRATAEHMKKPFVDFSGKTNVGELAALLWKCRLFISNDSGPVHIASAVGTPVISIFARKEFREDPGLSPKRWGPWGGKGVALYKDTASGEVEPKDVLQAARALLA